MKIKILILFILLLVPVCNSFSQIFDEIGVSLSGNQSNIVIDEVENFRNPAFGYGFGLFTEKKIVNAIQILSKLEYSARRYELDLVMEERSFNGEPTGETFGDKTTSTLHIISIPILMKIQSEKILPSLYLAFGPRLDLEVGAKKGKIKYDYRGDTFKTEDSLSDYSESVIWGFSATLGFDFKIFDHDINIDGRYNHDLSDLTQDDGFLSMRKRSFDIWLNIPFSFQKQ